VNDAFPIDPARVFERYRSIIDDWEAFLASLSRPLPTCIWTNTLRTSPESLQAWLERSDIDASPLAWHEGAFLLPEHVSPGNRIEYMTGLYHVQEEVSLLPPMFMDLDPSHRVLDLCAAPGNKSAQIAVEMDNRGTVVANDINHHRSRAIKRTIDRLGLANTCMTIYDGTSLPRDIGTFDRVLADVPCSCEGTTRKHPTSVENFSVEFSARLASKQIALLRKAFQVCEPGGRVVYSTCTFAPEENEGVVQKLIDDVGEDRVELLPTQVDGLETSPGLTEFNERTYTASMRHALRIWPHQNDTGGFFVAVLEKKN
jgi:NOL1/NOP2/sun family putative RNA methylase